MDLDGAKARQRELEKSGSLDQWQRLSIDVTSSLLTAQHKLVLLQRQLLNDVKAGASTATTRQAITALTDEAEGFRALKIEVDSTVLELQVLAGRRR